MTSFPVDIPTSVKMMTSSTACTKIVTTSWKMDIFRWFFHQIVCLSLLFPTIYHTRVFEAVFKNSIFFGGATAAAGSPAWKKNFFQNTRNEVLGKVKNFGYRFIYFSEVVNDNIWPLVDVIPSSLNRVNGNTGTRYIQGHKLLFWFTKVVKDNTNGARTLIMYMSVEGVVYLLVSSSWL